MLIPKTIHQIWLGQSPIPYEHTKWMHGIREMNPTWKYHLWRSTEGFDCHRYVTKAKSFSSLANCLRLELVHKYGGVYIDTDVEPLAPLDGLLDLGAFVGTERSYPLLVCNAVFGAVPSHPWITAQIAQLAERSSQPPPWGPTLMTETLTRDVQVLPRQFFYPTSRDLTVESLRRYTLLCHHWAKSW